MAATTIAPPEEPQVDEKPPRFDEPEPVREERFHSLLVQIFQGHQEFLGWTPD